MKLLVRWLLGLKSNANNSATSTLRLLYTVIIHEGDLMEHHHLKSVQALYSPHLQTAVVAHSCQLRYVECCSSDVCILLSSFTGLPTCLYLTVLVRKSASSTDVRLYFSKYRHSGSRKYRNRDVNACEFIASEADCRALVRRYRSLTFAYFRPFPGLKYTASPDWSKKFLTIEH